MGKWTAALTAVGLALTASACGGLDVAPQAGVPAGIAPALKGPLTVGSKIDTEGELLAEIIRTVLEHDGFEIIDRSQTGTTDVVRAALLSREIDIYPEYTGSGMIFFEDADPAVFKDGERGYEAVRALDRERNQVVWLSPARANNTWAIAARRDFAAAEGLSTMSDLAAYINAGKPTKIAASDEFFNNQDANPAFEATYGYDVATDQKLTFSGGNTAQTEKAVADGIDGVNFGMAYGTDGSLADLGLVILADDKGAQPVYWPVPITRADVVEQYPELEALLKPAFDALDLATLQTLNARIQVNGESADAVARDFLAQRGLTGGS